VSPAASHAFWRRAGRCLGLLWLVLAPGCSLQAGRLSPAEPEVVEVVSDASGAQVLRVDPAMLAEGTRIFDERCSPCHGVEGAGDGPLAEVLPVQPRNYRSDPFKWGTRLTDIVATISTGRSGIMPGFEGELTEREMWAAAYVVWSWIPPGRRDGELSATPAVKLQ